MKLTLALAMLAAFTGYAHAGNLYVPQVKQYVPKPIPGRGPCIQCGIQINPGYGSVINPAQNNTLNYVPYAVGKSAVR
jgi:hypothetical protein